MSSRCLQHQVIAFGWDNPEILLTMSNLAFSLQTREERDGMVMLMHCSKKPYTEDECFLVEDVWIYQSV